MPSQLFQQLDNLLQQSIGTQEDFTITAYDVLVDELYNEVENNVIYFASKFDQVLGMFYQLLKSYQAEGTTLAICSNMFQIFVIMIERRPILVSKNHNRLHTVIQELYEMYNMLNFSDDDNWSRPPEGFDQQNDFSQENTLGKQIMSYFDRIASIYTYLKFNEFIIQLLPSWWDGSETNWKARYTLLMVISQLGQKIEYPLTIKPFVDCAKISLSHPHPKVRFAALQTIGQFSDDMKPGFQQVYGEQILPLVFSCAKDEVPRVQSHAMACLTNFLEDFDPASLHILQPYVDQLINVSQNFCYNGISVVKETTISTLAAFSTINVLTQQQIDRILGILHQLLTSEQHQKQEYNHIINLTVECLSMLLYGQAKQKVQKYLTQSVNVIKSLTARLGPSYLVNAWSRLCCKYNNFTDLSDIFPLILQKVFQMIESYDSEVQVAIESIGNTLSSFKENIKPYMVQIFEFCKKSVQKQKIDDRELRPLLYSIMSRLIVNLKSQAPDPQYDELAKQTFTFFYEQVNQILNENQEAEHNCLEQGMEALQECIKYVGCLFTNENATKFAQDIFNFSSKISEIIQELNQEINEMKEKVNQTQDQLQQEDYNQIIRLNQEQIEKLYSARLIIPDVFESILTLISIENAKSIIQSLYPHVSNYLQTHSPYEDIRYGLFFLCDFLKAVKYEAIQDFAAIYQSTFCGHCLSPNIQVRNCAVYGLGELMKQIPPQKTDETLIYKWLNLLWNSLSISLGDETEKKKFNFAKDNIVSALGKLIFAKRQYYPVALNKQVHQKWFEHLPLNYDRQQGDIQQEILLTLLDQTPESFIVTKEDVFQLLTIFARYFMKRMHKTGELILKNKTGTKNFFFKMKNWPIFQENSDFLWNNLPMPQKTILTQLMSAP